MEPAYRKKLSFRKLLERNFHRNPIQHIARRSYLIAINTIVQEGFAQSLHIDSTNKKHQHNNSKAAVTYYNNGFLTRGTDRPRTQVTQRNLRRTMTSLDQHQQQENTQQRLRDSGGFSVYRKLQLGQRQLQIQLRKGECQMNNPFYKIQKPRLKTAPSFPVTANLTMMKEQLITPHSLQPPKTDPRSVFLRTASSRSRKPSLTRERSDTVQYQEVKSYFERKYGDS